MSDLTQKHDLYQSFPNLHRNFKNDWAPNQARGQISLWQSLLSRDKWQMAVTFLRTKTASTWKLAKKVTWTCTASLQRHRYHCLKG